MPLHDARRYDPCRASSMAEEAANLTRRFARRDLGSCRRARVRRARRLISPVTAAINTRAELPRAARPAAMRGRRGDF